ncbi:MAG: hypothetical protein K6L81_02655 [Agarilytica sp.]
MATDLAKLTVRLEAQTEKFQKELQKANKKLDRFEKGAKKSLKGLKTAFVAGFSAIGIGLFTRKVVSATIKQENAVKQLEATWKSTGGAVGLTVDEMIKEAGRLQDTTIFGDEDIIKAQSQLATFKNITTDSFKAATVAALDLSTKMDQSLNTSIVQLGKVLNDPIANLGALSRTGIQFSDDQKDTIKTLATLGDLAGAQKIILAELEDQFGGSAKAARETFGGALKALDNAFGDLFEADSMAGATEGIEELTQLLQNPETKAAAVTLANAIISAFTGVAKAITKTVNVMRFLGEEMAARISGPANDDLVRLEQKLERLKKRAPTLALNFYAPGLIDEQVNAWKKEIAELEALIDAEKARRQRNAVDLLSDKDLGGDVSADTINIEDDPEVKKNKAKNEVILSEEIKTGALITDIQKSEEQQRLRNISSFQAKVLQFQKASTKEKIKTTLSEGVALTQGAANTSRKLFKINKALALADAAVTLPSAVLKAVERGGGLPWGAAFGALTLASGLARIRAIKNAKFGGGSSASIAGTTGGATPTVDVSTPSTLDEITGQVGPQDSAASQTKQVHFHGDVYGFEEFRDLLASEMVRVTDTGIVRFTDSSGSLQMELT